MRSSLFRGIGLVLIALGGLALLVVAMATVIASALPALVLFLGVRLMLAVSSAEARALVRRWLKENRLKPGSAAASDLRRKMGSPAGRRA